MQSEPPLGNAGNQRAEYLRKVQRIYDHATRALCTLNDARALLTAIAISGFPDNEGVRELCRTPELAEDEDYEEHADPRFHDPADSRYSALRCALRSVRSDLYDPELVNKFSRFQGWWIADRPPTFALHATSVVEVIVTTMTRMRACLDLAWEMGSNLMSAARFVLERVEHLDEVTTEAALRCEVASMLRRDSALEGTARLNYPNGAPDYFSAAKSFAELHCDYEWRQESEGDGTSTPEDKQASANQDSTPENKLEHCASIPEGKRGRRADEARNRAIGSYLEKLKEDKPREMKWSEFWSQAKLMVSEQFGCVYSPGTLESWIRNRLSGKNGKNKERREE